jgi:1,4-dihydroxy-2-naphthoate polyprenyltransferase
MIWSTNNIKVWYQSLRLIWKDSSTGLLVWSFTDAVQILRTPTTAVEEYIVHHLFIFHLSISSLSSTVISRSTLILLRFHFSFFLLPVYLFAVSQATGINWTNAILVFVILHLLVYPSSNGYNSYMDRDESPIGGLKTPPRPTRQLFYVSVALDFTAILLSFPVSIYFALGIIIYIIASRLYSYRPIRLKKYPVAGFLTVFFCQGALIYLSTVSGVSNTEIGEDVLIKSLIASLLIGALYPLTQVYQHEADRKDGVETLSMLLGKKGSFVFTGLLFLLAGALIYLNFSRPHFILFTLVMLPVVLFFCYWMIEVWKNPAQANFKNAMIMNILATLCSTLFFIILIIQNIG